MGYAFAYESPVEASAPSVRLLEDKRLHVLHVKFNPRKDRLAFSELPTKMFILPMGGVDMTNVVVPTYTSTTRLGYEVLMNPPPRAMHPINNVWLDVSPAFLRFAPAVFLKSL